MNPNDYVQTDIWFAWFPVKTDEGWTWWENVERTIDYRPCIYLGHPEKYSYQRIEQ